MNRLLPTIRSTHIITSTTIRMTHQQATLTRHQADINPPVCSLKVADSFNRLNQQEKLYAHWMSRASWHGARIIMNQWTPKSEAIYDFILCLFGSAADPTRAGSFEALKKKSQLTSEWDEVLDYSAQLLSNLSNYKSFGATKFIPRCPPAAFEALIKASERSQEASQLWQSVKQEIYSLDPEPQLDIGKPSAGHLSNYYPNSPDISDQEINDVQAVCDAHQLSTLNTRLVKHSPAEFTLLIASVTDSLSPDLFPTSPLKNTNPERPLTIHLKPADFSAPLTKVCEALSEAKRYSGSELRSQMIEDYIKCFTEGDMNAHKSASKKWVKDVSPVVESYLGHIEAYVDPFAQRAEWEGFTAIVNKELSRKFETLVDRAQHLVQSLPWGKSFEVDVFRRPDFTALEILNFATGGIPAGINIPNYFDVRESTGFKNVSLANILSAKAPDEEITFIHPSERDLFAKWDAKTFDLQVANHELLGHGSGKLLQENKDGSFNFDPKTTINPLTGKPVETWYKPGETYGSKFGVVASSMEECRAEAVALYLCSNLEILKIFGYEDKEEIETIQYMTFLLMARAGVRALEWYDPQTKKHGQAHMQARLGITKWMIDHGLAQLEEVRKGSVLEDAYIRVDKQLVLENGKQIIGKLLVELQIRKSIADGKGAEKFYHELTTPPNELWETELRQLVIKKKQPRKIFVQPNTIVNDDEKVNLVEYPVDNVGVIESFLNRNI